MRSLPEHCFKCLQPFAVLLHYGCDIFDRRDMPVHIDDDICGLGQRRLEGRRSMTNTRWR